MLSLFISSRLHECPRPIDEISVQKNKIVYLCTLKTKPNQLSIYNNKMTFRTLRYRSIILLPALLALYSCNRASIFYTKHILYPVVQNEYRTFSIELTNSNDTNYTGRYKVYRCPQSTTIHSLNSDVLYSFTDESLKVVDLMNRELTVFSDGPDVDYNRSIRYYRLQYLLSVVEYIYPLIHQDDLLSTSIQSTKFNGIADTMINGEAYTVLTKDDMSSHFFNDTTQEFDIPNYRTIKYFYSPAHGGLQFIVASPMDYPGNGAHEFGTRRYDIGISYENHQAHIDSVTDFENPCYSTFTRHNNTDNPPLSWLWRSTENRQLTNEVVDFPIVSLGGDTTSLGQQHGWLLVDFWYSGCKPCYLQMKQLHDDPSVLATLREKGIHFMMINPLAASTESLLPIVARYGLEAYTYHAKGLSNVFSIKSMPRLILISPDKKKYFDLKTLDEAITFPTISRQASF